MRDWNEEIPPIQCLVINKRDRLPGEGIGWFGIDKRKFRKLPKREQRRLIDVETRNILDYSRWPEVLRAFGLAAVSRNCAQPYRKQNPTGPQEKCEPHPSALEVRARNTKD